MHPKLHIQISLKSANTVLLKAKVKVKAGNNQQNMYKVDKKIWVVDICIS